MEKTPQTITYAAVKAWIITHSDDQEMMDAINKLTYIFTSKYSEQTKNR